MGNTEIFLLFLLIPAYAIICAFLGAWLAGQKNQDKSAWFMLCLLFNILALITLAGAPIRPKE